MFKKNQSLSIICEIKDEIHSQIISMDERVHRDEHYIIGNKSDNYNLKLSRDFLNSQNIVYLNYTNHSNNTIIVSDKGIVITEDKLDVRYLERLKINYQKNIDRISRFDKEFELWSPKRDTLLAPLDGNLFKAYEDLKKLIRNQYLTNEAFPRDEFLDIIHYAYYLPYGKGIPDTMNENIKQLLLSIKQFR